MSSRTTTDAAARAFDEAIAETPTCALDDEGVAAQRGRYARLSPDVVNFEREPEAVIFDFRAEYDRATLDEALAVERECCPFFVFEFDEGSRRLRTTVREPEMLPALDAMAEAFGKVPRA